MNLNNYLFKTHGVVKKKKKKIGYLLNYKLYIYKTTYQTLYF